MMITYAGVDFGRHLSEVSNLELLIGEPFARRAFDQNNTEIILGEIRKRYALDPDAFAASVRPQDCPDSWIHSRLSKLEAEHLSNQTPGDGLENKSARL